MHRPIHPLNSNLAIPAYTKQAFFSASANGAHYDFPVLTPEEARVSNACYGRSAHLDPDNGDFELSIAFRSRNEETSLEELLAISFTCAEYPCQLLAPLSAIARLTAPYGGDLDRLSSNSVLLLLEHRLTGLLNFLEHRFHGPILLRRIDSATVLRPPAESICLDARCQLNGERNWVTLVMPHALARRLGEWLATQHQPNQPPGVAPILAIRTGYVHLTVGELESIKLNDVVLTESFDDEELFAVYGERYGARARRGDGRLWVVGPVFALSEDRRKVWSMADNADESVEIQPLDGAYEDVLVKLIFEVGRMEIELGAVKRLAEGQVFELGRDPGTAVDIIAGNRRIGRGDLVRIGDTIGVRITRLFNHE